MASITIPSDQWAKILQLLRDCPDVYVGDAAECQRFVEGVLWMDRSGAQWRLLPAEYGNWNTIYKRFARWCDRGNCSELMRSAGFLAVPRAVAK